MSIYRYTFRRIIQMIPVLFGVFTLTFILMYMLPGDPVRIYLGLNPSQEVADDLIREYGLDRPVWEQYLDYLFRVLQGDLGQSFARNAPVTQLFMERLEPTAVLMTLSYVVALPIAIGFGLYGAARHNRAGDHVTRFLGLAGLSTPNFWLGLMLIYAFAYTFTVFPASGYVSPFEDPVESARHLILPLITLATAQTALLMRMTRSSMIEKLSEEYVTTARAYGLPERRIIVKHAFRNALLPLVTIIGLQMSLLLSGSVIVEEIFAIPGMGRLGFQAFLDHDYSVVVGLNLIFGLMFLIGVLLTDLAYAYIDPRIKYD